MQNPSNKKKTHSRKSKAKNYVTPVFFKLLTRFWCLNARKFRQKSIGEEDFKLIE